MKTIAFALSSILLGSLVMHDAAAQAAHSDRRANVPMASLAGAGGLGGAGGGAEGTYSRRGDVAYANRNRAYVHDVRTSGPPPMDPNRVINVVDCRLPFDAYKGNLQCR